MWVWHDNKILAEILQPSWLWELLPGFGHLRVWPHQPAALHPTQGGGSIQHFRGILPHRRFVQQEEERPVAWSRASAIRLQCQSVGRKNTAPSALQFNGNPLGMAVHQAERARGAPDVGGPEGVALRRATAALGRAEPAPLDPLENALER